MSQPVAPLLVFGWGNPSRGDDALGPLLVEQLAAQAQAQLPVGATRMPDRLPVAGGACA